MENVNKNKTTPNHYKMAIEPIDYIMANDLPFSEGNVVKYISRYKQKNGYEDLCKCVHYVLFTMQKEYGLSQDTIKNVMSTLNNEKYDDK